MSEEESLEAGVDSAAPEAVDVPVEAAPVEAVSDEAPVASDPSLSADTDPVDEAPVSFPSADEFAWDDWDGEDNSLPEQMHSWADKFRTHYTALSISILEAYTKLCLRAVKTRGSQSIPPHLKNGRPSTPTSVRSTNR